MLTIKNKFATACTNSEIVEFLYDDFRMNDMIKKVVINKRNKEHYHDMRTYLATYFLQMKTEKLHDILLGFSGEGIYMYASRIIKNQMFKPQKNYCLPYDSLPYFAGEEDNGVMDKQSIIEEEEYEEECKNVLKREFENLSFYQKHIWNLIINEGKTYKQLAQETGIKENSLYATISAIKKHMRKVYPKKY